MTTHQRTGAGAAVVRVSILAFPAEQLVEAERLMTDSEQGLSGILDLRGLRSYTCGLDRETNQFVNVSEWDTVADAAQMATFQPMLDLAGSVLALGATFLRPTPNFEQLWRWDMATVVPSQESNAPKRNREGT